MNKDELKKIEQEDGFSLNNNYHIESVNEREAVIKADITKTSNNIYGIVHGGFTFGLGDMTMGLLAAANKRQAVTMNSTINYLKPGSGKYLIAKAELIKSGKSTALLRANIYNDKDDLIATMEGNYFYIS